MESAIIVLLIILVASNGILLWLLIRKGKSKEDSQGFMMLQNQVQELNRTLDTKLGESSKQMSESVKAQLGESAKIVREVTKGLTKLGETNKKVISFADQLQHLQDILHNPKQRGVLGEYFLETVLQDVLPEGIYKTQYEFKNGEKVDAVVFIKNQIVPIDAKFSLENYNRMVEQRDSVERERLEKQFVNDLKLRIKETSKYIRPQEGTTDFAFMFIPSEGIYYDLLSNKVGYIKGQEDNLIQRAIKEYKVIIVSPTTFYAYLQTVMQGLRGLQIEEKAQHIMKRVEQLGRHIGSYEEFMKKLGISLGTTVGHYNTAHKELGKIDKDVLRITSKSIRIEPLALNRPDKDE